MGSDRRQFSAANRQKPENRLNGTPIAIDRVKPIQYDAHLSQLVFRPGSLGGFLSVQLRCSLGSSRGTRVDSKESRDVGCWFFSSHSSVAERVHRRTESVNALQACDGLHFHLSSRLPHVL
jgi:hypothetical protein